jgi:hypothetical protein
VSTTAVMNVADDSVDAPEAHGLENDDGADSR